MYVYTYIYTYILIYIHVYMFVCVCVCAIIHGIVCLWGNLRWPTRLGLGTYKVNILELGEEELL